MEALTPVRLPLGALTAYDLYAAPYVAHKFRILRWGRGEACAKTAPFEANILEGVTLATCKWATIEAIKAGSNAKKIRTI